MARVAYPALRTLPRALSREARRREVERIARKVRSRARESPDARSWYREARRWAEEVAPGGADLLLGMLAATSARQSLTGNVRTALRAYRYAAAGLPTSWGAPYGVPSNAEAVARVAEGRMPNGPKVAPFLRALRGDPDAVAVDVWMSRIASYRRSPTPRERTILEAAIRVAARRLDWAPAEAQAAAWMSERRAAGYTSSETYRSAFARVTAADSAGTLRRTLATQGA